MATVLSLARAREVEDDLLGLQVVRGQDLDLRDGVVMVVIFLTGEGYTPTGTVVRI